MRLPTLPWFVECVQEQARAKALGASIRFGREPLTRSLSTECLILVDHQRGEAVDAFDVPKENPNRPKASDGSAYQRVFRRAIAAEALIFAVSTKRGATRADHVERCDELLNDFIVAAYEAARESSCRFLPTGGGSPRPEDETDDALASGYVELGARYLLRFAIEAPVVGRPIQKARIGAAPDVTIETTITVPFNGTDWTTEV